MCDVFTQMDNLKVKCEVANTGGISLKNRVYHPRRSTYNSFSVFYHNGSLN